MENKKLRVELTEGDHKFIIYETKTEIGVISKRVHYHKDILKTLESVNKEDVKGGGRITYKEETGYILIHDCSGDFGYADLAEVLQLFDLHFGNGNEATITEAIYEIKK